MSGQANGKGPPANIPPSELWALITQLPRPHRLVDFPAKDPNGEPVGQVAIRVLSQEELMICASNAAKVAKDMLREQMSDAPQLAYEKIYQDACVCEVLHRACRDVKSAPEYNRPAFPAPREVRQRLTLDQTTVLMRAYLRVEAELGPIIAALEPEELNAWIGRLAQAGNAFPLVSLSRQALETLALSLALRLASSSTDTSSPGSPPDDGTESEKAPPPSSPSPANSSEAADDFSASAFTEDDPTP